MHSNAVIVSAFQFILSTPLSDNDNHTWFIDVMSFNCVQGDNGNKLDLIVVVPQHAKKLHLNALEPFSEFSLHLCRITRVASVLLL